MEELEKPMVVSMNCEGLDDKEIEMVLACNENNNYYYNVVI